MAAIFTYENKVFKSYMFYTMILVLKLVFMSFFTAGYRFMKMAFINEEDCSYYWENGKPRYPVVTSNDPDVERIRRNHLNDLENIIPFILVGLLYVTTNPAVSVAVWHFRIFTVARFMHFIAYQKALPQPSRGMTFGVGAMVTTSMIIQNIIFTL